MVGWELPQNWLSWNDLTLTRNCTCTNRQLLPQTENQCISICSKYITWPKVKCQVYIIELNYLWLQLPSMSNNNIVYIQTNSGPWKAGNRSRPGGKCRLIVWEFRFYLETMQWSIILHSTLHIFVTVLTYSFIIYLNFVWLPGLLNLLNQTVSYKNSKLIK